MDRRIVDGYFYAVTSTTALNDSGGGDTPVGEVVYWADIGDCAVMLDGWDAAVDTSDDAEIWSQLELYSEEDRIRILGWVVRTDLLCRASILKWEAASQITVSLHEYWSSHSALSLWHGCKVNLRCWLYFA